MRCMNINKVYVASSCCFQGWNDYHLAWNESDYAGVKSIRIPAELLWKPDILMYNR